MAISAAVMVAATVGTAAYGVAKDQGAMHKAHGAANVQDAQLGQLQKTVADERSMEENARKSALLRKKQYQDVGRSSTILTGPMGLGGSGTTTGKTLLGS